MSQPKQEIKRNEGVTQVFDSGILVGEIKRIKAGCYEWQSYVAKNPFRSGRCDTEAEGLAHIGYKFKKHKPISS